MFFEAEFISVTKNGFIGNVSSEKCSDFSVSKGGNHFLCGMHVMGELVMNFTRAVFSHAKVRKKGASELHLLLVFALASHPTRRFDARFFSQHAA